MSSLILSELERKDGLKVVTTISEEKSAHYPGREGFGKLMKLLREGKINAFLVWDADRLARNMIDGGEICHALQTGQLKQIRTPFEIYDKNTDMILLSVKFGNSTQQSRSLSKNVHRGIESVLKKGLYPGIPPIGYRKGTEEEKKKHGNAAKFPDDNFPLVKKAFELYNTGNYSLRTLTEHLHKKGMSTQFKNPINKTSVERVLRTPFYYGEIHWTNKSTGEMTVYQGVHKPAITKSLFLRVQARLDGKILRGDKRHNYTYKKRVKCSCGRFLIPSRHKTHIYLECHNKKQCDVKFLVGEKHKKSLREDILEQSVVKALERIKIEAEVFERLKNDLLKKNEIEFKEMEERKSIFLKQVENIDRELKTLNQKLIKGMFDDEEFMEMRNDLKNRKKTIYAEMEEVEDEIDDELADTTMKYMTIGRALRGEYMSFNSGMKRRCLELFFRSLVIRNSKVLIDYTSIAKDLIGGTSENDYLELQGSQSESGVTEQFNHAVPHGARGGTRTLTP